MEHHITQVTASQLTNSTASHFKSDEGMGGGGDHFQHEITEYTFRDVQTNMPRMQQSVCGANQQKFYYTF